MYLICIIGSKMTTLCKLYSHQVIRYSSGECSTILFLLCLDTIDRAMVDFAKGYNAVTDVAAAKVSKIKHLGDRQCLISFINERTKMFKCFCLNELHLL